MANQIAEKLELLKCPPEMKDIALKFSASLTCVTLEELKGIIDFLTQKGVVAEGSGILLQPKAFKILPRGLEFIQSRVSEMEAIGELDCYKEKPYRITIVDSDKRLKYMKDHNEPYKTEDGKYSMVAFSKIDFEKKFGQVDFNKVEDVTPVVEEPKEEVIPAIEETITPIESDNSEEVNLLDALPDNNEVESIPVTLTDIPSDADSIVPVSDNNVSDEKFTRLSNKLKVLYNDLFGMPDVPADMLECLKTFILETDYDDVTLIFELLTSGSNYSDEAKSLIRTSIEDVVGNNSQVRGAA